MLPSLYEHGIHNISFITGTYWGRQSDTHTDNVFLSSRPHFFLPSPTVLSIQLFPDDQSGNRSLGLFFSFFCFVSLLFFNYGATQDWKTSRHKASLKCEFKVGKDEAFTRLMQLILLVNYILKMCTQSLISLLLWRVTSEKLYFSSGFPSDKGAWKASHITYQ